MVTHRAYVAPVAAVLASPPPGARLTAAEQARADAFRAARDRDAFVAAHLLARACAADHAGVAPALTLEQTCPRCGGPHGPPRIRELPGVVVSLAHADGVVAAAAGTGPLGVDVETPVGRRLDLANDRTLALVLAPAERGLLRRSADPAGDFLRLWVCKEAIVKALQGTLGQLPAIDLVGPGGALAARWRDLALAVHEGPAGALVACAAPEPVEVQAWPAETAA
jgi:4'-phosphopantetheinyl transferase